VAVVARLLESHPHREVPDVLPQGESHPHREVPDVLPQGETHAVFDQAR
jgi:hypothetical protein